MISVFVLAQGHDHDHGDGHNHNHDSPAGYDQDNADHGNTHDGHDGGHHANYLISNPSTDCGASVSVDQNHEYDPTATAIHHISDANVYTILDAVRIPLPAILYSKDRGVEFFSTGKFEAGHHDNGAKSYNGYVLFEGNIHKLACSEKFVDGTMAVDGFGRVEVEGGEGKSIERRYAVLGGKGFLLEQKTIWDGGILGGGVTSFMDLSPTKSVVSMLIVCLILFFAFRAAAKAYTRNEGQAPSGIQSFLEPIFQFIRDDVAIPFIGEKKYEKYLPLLMTIFFFILGLNLWGQIPFLGSVNVTGSLTVTMILAVLVFLITNFSGNKNYWGHIFNFPGVPWFVKLILTPVEVLGLFIKPLTLMLRLAGNITAGHIAILSFVGLIFIFGNSGTNMAGASTGTVLAIPLTIFMMSIELIVAFVQAFVFTILTASYIGAATEEHH
jgi:F-type H+-transporting ATPase subunit a